MIKAKPEGLKPDSKAKIFLVDALLALALLVFVSVDLLIKIPRWILNKIKRAHARNKLHDSR